MALSALKSSAHIPRGAKRGPTRGRTTRRKPSQSVRVDAVVLDTEVGKEEARYVASAQQMAICAAQQAIRTKGWDGGKKKECHNAQRLVQGN